MKTLYLACTLVVILATQQRVVNSKDDSGPCSLPRSTGPCRGHMPRWYHDVTDHTCKRFVYGGCRGNNNRFRSIDACEAACVSAGPGEEPVNSDCRMRAEVGPCRMAITRWYHDDSDGVCKTFTYGGCRGNGNNFRTLQECEDNCAVIDTEPWGFK